MKSWATFSSSVMLASFSATLAESSSPACSGSAGSLSPPWPSSGDSSPVGWDVGSSDPPVELWVCSWDVGSSGVGAGTAPRETANQTPTATAATASTSTLTAIAVLRWRFLLDGRKCDPEALLGMMAPCVA